MFRTGMAACVCAAFLLVSCDLVPNVPYSEESVSLAGVGEPYVVRMFVPEGAAGADISFVVALDGDFEYQTMRNTIVELVNEGAIEPIGLVAVSYGDLLEVNGKRYNDLSIASDTNPDGRFDEVADFIEDTMIPAARSKFPQLSGDSAKICFAGHSLGGLDSLYLLFTRTQSFGAYLAMSPSVWFGPWMLLDIERSYFEAGNTFPADTKVFTSVGEAEPGVMTIGVDEFTKAITKDFPSLWYKTTLIRGGDHMSNMPQAFEEGIRALYAR